MHTREEESGGQQTGPPYEVMEGRASIGQSETAPKKGVEQTESARPKRARKMPKLHDDYKVGVLHGGSARLEYDSRQVIDLTGPHPTFTFSF